MLVRKQRKTLVAAATVAWLGLVGAARLEQAPRTWVVDDDGPADFAEVAPALAAVRAGDRVRIRAGRYAGFSVDRPVTLVGEAGAEVGEVLVRAPASIAGLSIPSLTLLDVQGTVVLDGLFVFGGTSPQSGLPTAAFVRDCEDVRIIDSQIWGLQGDPDGSLGLRVSDSHVELVDCVVGGGFGARTTCDREGPFVGGHGGSGIRIGGASRVLMMLSSAFGGEGGDDDAWPCSLGYGGDGGHGVEVRHSSELVAAGVATDRLEGGFGGLVFPVGGAEGWDGEGLQVDPPASARVSGIKVSSTSGTVSKPMPADPALERIGELVDPFLPGASSGNGGLPTVAGVQKSSVTLRVHGHPGSFTRLFLGSEPQILASPTVEVELLLKKELTIDLGFLPASGTIDYVLQLNPMWPQAWGPVPDTLYAQASLIYPGGEIRRTNSVPMVVR